MREASGTSHGCNGAEGRFDAEGTVRVVASASSEEHTTHMHVGRVKGAVRRRDESRRM
jgi:hypothetical protein